MLRKPASAAEATAVRGLLVAELAVLVALSHEFAEVMVRLGYNEPCEVRRLPVARSLTALRASPQWRERCWRFAVFPGMLTGRRVEVVFAVSLKPRHPQVQAGLYDSSAASRTLPAIPRPRQSELPSAPPPKILWFSRRL